MGGPQKRTTRPFRDTPNEPKAGPRAGEGVRAELGREVREQGRSSSPSPRPTDGSPAGGRKGSGRGPEGQQKTVRPNFSRRKER